MFTTRRKRRSAHGVTLLELLVIVGIVALLVSIAIPNYYASQRRAHISSVKANMHSNQVAAEAFSVDTGGSYATEPKELAPYFPGGGSSPGGKSGTFPSNPISGKTNEEPAPCIVPGTMWIGLLRSTRGTDNFGGTTGQSTYVGIADNQDVTFNNSFAITGNGEAGIAVAGPEGYAVLSNM